MGNGLTGRGLVRRTGNSRAFGLRPKERMRMLRRGSLLIVILLGVFAQNACIGTFVVKATGRLDGAITFSFYKTHEASQPSTLPVVLLDVAVWANGEWH